MADESSLEAQEKLSPELTARLAYGANKAQAMWFLNLAIRQDESAICLAHTMNGLPKDDPQYETRFQILRASRKVLERDAERNFQLGVKLLKEMKDS